MAASSLAASARSDSRRCSHQLNGLNQNTARLTPAANWIAKSRRATCAPSCASTANRLAGGQAA